MKNKVFFIFVLICSPFLYALPHSSSQSHQSQVTSLAIVEDIVGQEETVFSSGNDGFLIKWGSDGLGEHYQFSDIPIKIIAKNPKNNDVAIYETDGAGMNMVSVWDFNRQSRKCAFTFSDPITSLSYSAKGNYVLCGTASVKGTYFLNTANNTITSKKLKESTGPVTMAITSESEKTVLIYSPTGSLAYYNMITGQKKAKFYTESYLNQPGVFNNNVFFAGYKDGFIHVMQATTGKTISKFSTGNKEPVLIYSNKSENLYYIINENRQFKLYMIQNDRNKNVIEPQPIRTFTGLKNDEAVVCASLTGNTIFAGTSKGNIYKFDNSVAERVDVLQAISDNMYDYIYDVCAVGDNFYFLTPDAIFLSSYDNGVVDKKGVNPGHTDIITFGDNVILWTKNSRAAVNQLDFSTGNLTKIFTPENNLTSLKLYGDKLLAIEGSSTINRYDISNGKKEELYMGTGIQDAILYTDKDLYVAKTSATNPSVPLLYINTITKETVPLSLKGNVAYALNADTHSDNGEIYGIVVGTNSSGMPQTSVFSYSPKSKSTRFLITDSSEDNNAICYLSYPTLYTNIGKSKVRSYNFITRRNFEYKRSASLPLKVSRNSTRLVVLNRDGSISWYNPDMSGVIADWYLTIDGQWYEF